MLSVARTKDLLGDLTMSDEDAIAIRDEMRLLAEIIFDHYQQNHRPRRALTRDPP